MDKNIVLIGLGPHAKRIYMNLMKKHNVLPKLIVDLKNMEQKVLDYLKKEQMIIDTYFVPDQESNSLELSELTKKNLILLFKKYNIKYAIISTEPKAHFAYAKFLLDQNINILMDKPITSPLYVFKNIENSKKIEEEYNILKEKYQEKKESINFTIQCQRRFHAGYNYVKNLIEETVLKYEIPITYLDIYHSDGMWNMPDEFFSRENHPYKYGYGKLFHSGYHFVDLITWLLESNSKLKTKKTNNLSITTSLFRPMDFFQTIDNKFYEKYFQTEKYKEILKNTKSLKDFGELDFHSMIDFKMDDKIITHCTLNLMQSGFSKRAWKNLPKDTYKANGRVRHERVNIHVGPILNIQIHSYQSYEVNEKSDILKDDIEPVFLTVV